MNETTDLHKMPNASTSVNHPSHYGGDTQYEAIKVIEAWQLGFCLGNTVKYIRRAGQKQEGLQHKIEDLEKAQWYLAREIQRLKPEGGLLQLSGFVSNVTEKYEERANTTASRATGSG